MTGKRGAEQIANQIRGLWPWPGAQSVYVSAETGKHWRMTLSNARPLPREVKKGDVVGQLDENLHVICGRGALQIAELKPAGSGLMSFESFVNGHGCQTRRHLHLGRKGPQRNILMTPQPFTARKTAWLVLNQCDITRHDAAELLNQYLPTTDRPDQATDIVFGVLRNRLAIDGVIKKCGSVEPDRVKPGLWNLLRIGTYELVYAPKTAEYGILNEVGDLARQKGTARTVGFVNAVLRVRSKKHCVSPNTARRRRPANNSAPGCTNRLRLLSAMLPNPEKDPVIITAWRFRCRHGSFRNGWRFTATETTRQICLASNRASLGYRPAEYLMHDSRKTGGPIGRRRHRMRIERGKKHAVHKHAGQITKIQAFLDGLFTIQDPTAAEAMRMSEPQPGWTVADCVLRGGKSIALAMLMGDTGMILASDSDRSRLQKVRQNVKRMRLNAMKVVDSSKIQQTCLRLKSLDAIILDVPCSNSGVLARRVEARWRLQKNNTKRLLQTQQQLLNIAASLCHQNTRIVYSTCSIQPEENQQQIQQFLKQFSAFTLKKEKLTLPVLKTEKLFDHDGGYVAVLACN